MQVTEFSWLLSQDSPGICGSISTALSSKLTLSKRPQRKTLKANSRPSLQSGCSEEVSLHHYVREDATTSFKSTMLSLMSITMCDSRGVVRRKEKM